MAPSPRTARGGPLSEPSVAPSLRSALVNEPPWAAPAIETVEGKNEPSSRSIGVSTMTIPNASDGEGLATPPIADNWDIRILRRVGPLQDLERPRDPEPPFRRVGVVDVETTGTDPLHDQVIDIAYVIIDVDARGDIV